MEIYVAIDDTDSLELGATGQSANELRRLIEDRNWGKTEAVTRHQLLLHPDIPYTSHNSAMCFKAVMGVDKLDEFIACAGKFLQETSAPGSDPGLCVAVKENIKNMEELLSFGYKAKEEVLTKAEAYKTAEHCGLHISEHGGTGLGIIGALAGIGLRITGNDGRFQGRMQLGNSGETIAVGEIISKTEIDEVQSIDGQVLANHETMVIGEKIKTVLLEGKRILLVYREGGAWHSCNNKQLKNY
ncbi:hypothetical protein [Syntrophomonas wolfei]|uniref:hypothetical protein n=1 Tax=Syntrophomonas wolfei TaxID=863 RepID=UPI0023F25E3A|nr:hypothetical protein [Syntrophomonas wolfei]